ncbi:MAG: hypothetical protein ACKESB_02995 [Candidatus Hodgkinia cicadicola]
MRSEVHIAYAVKLNLVQVEITETVSGSWIRLAAPSLEPLKLSSLELTNRAVALLPLTTVLMLTQFKLVSSGVFRVSTQYFDAEANKCCNWMTAPQTWRRWRGRQL